MTASEMRDTPEFIQALDRAMGAPMCMKYTNEEYDVIVRFREEVLHEAKERVLAYQRLLP